jgi:hypothetical protein
MPTPTAHATTMPWSPNQALNIPLTDETHKEAIALLGMRCRPATTPCCRAGLH